MDHLLQFLRSLFRGNRPQEEGQTNLASVLPATPRVQRTQRPTPRPLGPEQEYNPEAEAARTILAPRHAEHQEVIFQQIGREGVLQSNSETWHREGNSMNSTVRKALVITCSGAVVSPEKIQAVCSQCGGYEDQVYRCSVCGKTLCRVHALLISKPEGTVILCEQHHQETLEGWDTWEAVDYTNSHLQKERKKLPRQAHSAASLAVGKRTWRR